jgi:ATP-dependent 26S proteasome regulatory subunit
MLPSGSVSNSGSQRRLRSNTKAQVQPPPSEPAKKNSKSPAKKEIGEKSSDNLDSLKKSSSRRSIGKKEIDSSLSPPALTNQKRKRKKSDPVNDRGNNEESSPTKRAKVVETIHEPLATLITGTDSNALPTTASTLSSSTTEGQVVPQEDLVQAATLTPGNSSPPESPCVEPTTSSTPSDANDKRIHELLDPICNLRNFLANVLSKLPKGLPTTPITSSNASAPAAATSLSVSSLNSTSTVTAESSAAPPLPLSSPTLQPQLVWGKLLSQLPEHPHALLCGSIFTIGRHPNCNLSIRDIGVSNILCRLHFIHALCCAFIECMSNGCTLALNGRTLRKGGKLIMRSGDEIAITTTKTYSFIYQQLINTPVAHSNAVGPVIHIPHHHLLPPLVQTSPSPSLSPINTNNNSNNNNGNSTASNNTASNTNKNAVPNIVVTSARVESEFQKTNALLNTTSNFANVTVTRQSPGHISVPQHNIVRVEDSNTNATSSAHSVIISNSALEHTLQSLPQSLQPISILNSTSRIDGDAKTSATAVSNQPTDIVENTMQPTEAPFQMSSQFLPLDTGPRLPANEDNNSNNNNNSKNNNTMENVSSELPQTSQTKQNSSDNCPISGSADDEGKSVDAEIPSLLNDAAPLGLTESVSGNPPQKVAPADHSCSTVGLVPLHVSATASNNTSSEEQTSDDNNNRNSNNNNNNNRNKGGPYLLTLSPQIPVISHNNTHVVVTQQFTSPSMFSTLKLPDINSTTATTITTQASPRDMELDDKSDSIQQGKDAESIRSQWRQTFQQLITSPKDIPISFQNFPYHLSNNLKRLVVNSVYIFLEQPHYVKYTTELASVSRRILLSGPMGSEIMQERLVDALAVHFRANLLTIDSLTLMTQENSSPKESNNLDAIDDDVAESWLSLGTEGLQRRPFKKGDKVKYIGSGIAPYSRSTTWTTANTPNDVISTVPSVATVSGVAAVAAAAAVSTNIRKNENPASALSTRGPQYGASGKVVLTFDDNPRKVGVRFDKPIVGGINLGGLCEDQHGFFVDVADLKHENDLEECIEGIIIETLFEVVSKPENQPCILLIRNLEKTISANYERYTYFKKELDKLSGRVVVIGISTCDDSRKESRHASSFLVSKSNSSSHTALMDITFLDHLRSDHIMKESSKSFKLASKLFPHKISVYPPQEADKLQEWEKLIRNDVEKMKADINWANLKRIMEKNNIVCNEVVDSKRLRKKILSNSQLEKVVAWSISDHLMNNSNPNTAMVQNTNINVTTSANTLNSVNTATGTIPKLFIAAKSIQNALALLEHAKPPKLKSIFDIETDNDFEKRLLSDVIPPNELGVRFDDIGALDSVKETLKELVMLPLQRPELFRKGNLTKPTKGILLFGPPGTGKTMLAKAVATESGANFINVSMASISSKWFGEAEKYARAVFTLASKIAPSVIFIDEVDSILGRRDKHGEHEAMRKIKNEFMAMWDGLKTKEGERVLVLAATNRPFDLDDAVLRRLPRRLLVDLPDAPNRKKILKVILAKEDLAPEVDLDALAEMTEGFSGSDLKNLCIAAAYQPIREILEKEKKEMEESGGILKNSAVSDRCVAADSLGAAVVSDTVEEQETVEKPTPYIRPLTMKDFEKAKKEVCASVNEDAVSIAELRKWNEMYGVNAGRSKPILSYFV